MNEKGIAVVICIIAAVIVVYAGVFMLQIKPDPGSIVVPGSRKSEVVAHTPTLPEEELPKKQYRPRSAPTARHKPNPMEQWMQECLRTGVLESLDRANHEVAIDPVTWRLALIDEKWTFMKCVHVYFDGYATIVSSTSGRPLASYNAWSGIKIHD